MVVLTQTAAEKTAEKTAETVNNVKSGAVKEWLDSLLPKALSFFWCVVLAFLVWIIGRWILQRIRNMIKKIMNRHNIETGVVQFVDSLVKWIGYIVMIVIILNLFGIETSSMAAAIASLGVTAGPAMQGSLSNFAGGVLILLLHPFRVGDYIKEDTHGNEGTVKEISLFYTKLATIDKKIIVIPNGVLANSSLTNASASDIRLLDLDFTIGYDDDIKKAKDVLKSVAENEDRRLKDQPVSVFVRNLGDNAVTIAVRLSVKNDDYWDVRSDLIEAEKYALDNNGISIPYPQLDVHSK